MCVCVCMVVCVCHILLDFYLRSPQHVQNDLPIVINEIEICTDMLSNDMSSSMVTRRMCSNINQSGLPATFNGVIKTLSLIKRN